MDNVIIFLTCFSQVCLIRKKDAGLLKTGSSEGSEKFNLRYEANRLKL